MTTYEKFMTDKSGHPSDNNGWPRYLGIRKEGHITGFVLQGSEKDRASYYIYAGGWTLPVRRTPEGLMGLIPGNDQHMTLLRPDETLALTEEEFARTQGPYLPTTLEKCAIRYNSRQIRLRLRSEGFSIHSSADKAENQAGLLFDVRKGIVMGLPAVTPEGDLDTYLKKNADTILDCEASERVFLCQANHIRRRHSEQFQKSRFKKI